MFHLSNDDILTLFLAKENSPRELISKLRAHHQSLFFTPYENKTQLGEELTDLIAAPVRLGGVAAGSALGVALAAATCIGSLCIAGAAALSLNTRLRTSALDCAMNALIMIGSGLVTIATSLLLAMVSIPYGLASLVTRSVSTLVGCTAKDNLEQESESLEHLTSTCTY